MDINASYKGSIENRLVRSMVYSWDYLNMSFPIKYNHEEAPYFVPNGLIELVFLKNLQVYENQPNKPLQCLSDSFIWGQTKCGSQVIIAGTGTWFEIKIQPWAFELLFGHSAHSLPIRGIPFSEISKEFELLTTQINASKNVSQAIRVFEQFAVQQLSQGRMVKPFLTHAFDIFLRSHGQIKVSSLCSKMNVSRQYFCHYFKDKIGLSPKYYAKIIRLRHAVDSIYLHPNRSQTEIALACGYFDQAHFIHDFKSILHQTPTNFFKQKQFIYWDL